MSGPPIIVYACLPFDRRLNGVTAAGVLRAAHDIRSLGQGFLACIGLFGDSLAGAVCSALVLYLLKGFTAVRVLLYSGIAILTCAGIGDRSGLVLPAVPKSLQGLT